MKVGSFLFLYPDIKTCVFYPVITGLKCVLHSEELYSFPLRIVATSWSLCGGLEESLQPYPGISSWYNVGQDQ